MLKSLTWFLSFEETPFDEGAGLSDMEPRHFPNTSRVWTPMGPLNPLGDDSVIESVKPPNVKSVWRCLEGTRCLGDLMGTVSDTLKLTLEQILKISERTNYVKKTNAWVSGTTIEQGRNGFVSFWAAPKLPMLLLSTATENRLKEGVFTTPLDHPRRSSQDWFWWKSFG